MVLTNKYVLSAFGFKSTNCLLLYQTFCCVVIVRALDFCGAIKLEPVSFKLIKVWAPVNFIFVGMIWTSFFSLKLLGVAMMTVLKNTTNILVVFGDIYWFNRKQPFLVWISLILIILSAVCGAITDMSFDAAGYSWQILNCFFTAAYSVRSGGPELI
jgi:GDP-mannose transporter